MPSGDSLKQRIHDGEIVIGVSAPMTSSKSQLEEILSKDTYGFVSVDSQHSPFSEDRLVEFCSIAEELGTPVQLRIKHTRHTYMLGNLLDLGPLGIEVPQVEEESTVREALDSFYYPQVGMRSMAGAARYGLAGRGDRLEYAEWWNGRGILCLQMESIDAVTNARKLAMPGVDCLTWGPLDLSFSMEAYPQHWLKTVDDCVRHVLKQLEGTNVRISFRSYDPELRNKYIDMGVTVLMERPKG